MYQYWFPIMAGARSAIAINPTGCDNRRWTFPVAVPDKIFGLALFLDFIDRCHSLRSLNPPPAALLSLPTG